MSQEIRLWMGTNTESIGWDLTLTVKDKKLVELRVDFGLGNRLESLRGWEIPSVLRKFRNSSN